MEIVFKFYSGIFEMPIISALGPEYEPAMGRPSGFPQLWKPEPEPEPQQINHFPVPEGWAPYPEWTVVKTFTTTEATNTPVPTTPGLTTAPPTTAAPTTMPPTKGTTTGPPTIGAPSTAGLTTSFPTTAAVTTVITTTGPTTGFPTTVQPTCPPFSKKCAASQEGRAPFLAQNIRPLWSKETMAEKRKGNISWENLFEN